MNPYGTSNTTNFPSLSQTSAQSPSYAYKPNYGADTTIGQFINKATSMLQPQKSFNQTLDYNQYAAPQRAAFDLWNQQNLKPQFEYFQYNPYKEQTANNMAAGNANYMGNAGSVAQRGGEQFVQQNYTDPMESARTQYEDMMRTGYNQALGDYYASPTSYNNIGQIGTTTPAKATNYGQALQDLLDKYFPNGTFAG